ncbi:phage tail assembly protein [Paenibacillus sp. MCAF20]
MEAKTYTLKKPIEFEGEQITEIVLDFDNATSDDYQSAEQQFKAQNTGFAAVLTVESGFLAIFAARAAKKPPELFRKLYAKDYAQIVQLTQNFLLG